MTRQKQKPKQNLPRVRGTSIVILDSSSFSFSIYGLVFSLVLLLFFNVPLAAVAYDNGLGKTPQMGWNPWNLFGCDANETIVRSIAASMVSTGLSDLGYKYINLDDCWQVSRNSTGHIVEDPRKFPSGMASLSRFVHQQGLKFGVYSDSGLFTCQRRPGSLGYEIQDAESYVEWEIDYLKYDNCFATGLGGGVRKRYKTMRDALNQTAMSKAKATKPIFFSLCEWGIDDPATWASDVGNSWRTTGDIQKSWESILGNLDENDKWHAHAGPGGWNDPDMLQVGTTTNDELTIAEQRAHFTLWCLIKSPLLLANDLRAIPDPILDILSNPEVIALNQDPLGVQGYKRSSSAASGGDLEVWAGDLEGGDVAVVLFNRSTKNHTITVRFEDVVTIAVGNSNGTTAHSDSNSHDEIETMTGTRATMSAHVRDLWAHSDLGVHKEEFQGLVPSHDVMALRLSRVSIAMSKSVPIVIEQIQ